MSRDKHKKIDVGGKPAPALQNPFAALGQMEALQNLPAAPEKPKVETPVAVPKPPPRHRGG